MDIGGDVDGSITTEDGNVDVTGDVTDSITTEDGDVNVGGDVVGAIDAGDGDVSIAGSVGGGGTSPPRTATSMSMATLAPATNGRRTDGATRRIHLYKLMFQFTM